MFVEHFLRSIRRLACYLCWQVNVLLLRRDGGSDRLCGTKGCACTVLGGTPLSCQHLGCLGLLHCLQAVPVVPAPRGLQRGWQAAVAATWRSVQVRHVARPSSHFTRLSLQEGSDMDSTSVRHRGGAGGSGTVSSLPEDATGMRNNVRVCSGAARARRECRCDPPHLLWLMAVSVVAPLVDGSWELAVPETVLQQPHSAPVASHACSADRALSLSTDTM